MKKCKDCGTDKSEAEFYGVQGECKSCTKERIRKREKELSKDPTWLEKERKRHRDKYHKLGYKDLRKPTPEQKKTTMEKYKNKYPEKISAHLFLLGRKLKAKNIGSHLHHWSYNKEHWIDCIELTELEHNKLHRYIIYDQERMMYRRSDNNELLHTKEKHIEYFNLIKTKP